MNYCHYKLANIHHGNTRNGNQKEGGQEEDPRKDGQTVQGTLKKDLTLEDVNE